MEQKKNIALAARSVPMAHSLCWHCHSEVKGEYLCGQCVKVQPLSKELDYFTCLRLPRRLNLDEQTLENTFYELSRTFHPDFYSRKDESEQSISLGNSALLNTAYRTLKDPFQRAEYLIRLEAGSTKNIRSNPPADLFAEILELQETLEEFRSTSSKNQPETSTILRKKLQTARQNLEHRRLHLEMSIVSKFDEWDRLQLQAPNPKELREEKDAILKDIQANLSNRTYIQNMVNELVETLEPA